MAAAILSNVRRDYSDSDDESVSDDAMFITDCVEQIVLRMTNLEGSRKHGNGWKGVDVYRSRGEVAASLWDSESGWAVFQVTMPLKVFLAYSALLRFDDRDMRPARRATDKLAAVRDVWDAWAERLPCLYNPGPNITVDEQLVRF